MIIKGPVNFIRSNQTSLFEHVKPLYEWSEKESYLTLEEIKVRDTAGAIVCYHNPPVHQVGNAALDAYLVVLSLMQARQKELQFLIMYSANDPIHAGGDLKESLVQLDRTLELRKNLLVKGSSAADIDLLYNWGDERLQKAFQLYRALRQLGKDTRIIGICGGGARYGGSAELVLMADVIVGDSRSAICFSEVLLGLIPGWGGIGRTISRSGLLNARYLAYTAAECPAADLKKMGIFNTVVDVPLALPRLQKTADPQADKIRYQEALQKNNDETGPLLLAAALELAVCPQSAILRLDPQKRAALLTEEKLTAVIKMRSNFANYRRLVNKPLVEVKEELTRMGRPLAPQSVAALDTLFAKYDAATFDEERFIEQEMQLDARLYRDRRFRAGITATLEQRVPDFDGNDEPS